MRYPNHIILHRTMNMDGLIHVYHGDGKGKTSASVGLAVRAAGYGRSVIFLQFLKGSISHEIDVLKNINNIRVFRNSKDFGFINTMSRKEIAELTAMHNENLAQALSLVKDGKCDVLILDEICAAYELNVIDTAMVDSIILNKPASLELVLTGRNPAGIFLDNADYITEMRKERHPFDKNIMAREGIEY